MGCGIWLCALLFHFCILRGCYVLFSSVVVCSVRLFCSVLYSDCSIFVFCVHTDLPLGCLARVTSGAVMFCSLLLLFVLFVCSVPFRALL